MRTQFGGVAHDFHPGGWRQAGQQALDDQHQCQCSQEVISHGRGADAAGALQAWYLFASVLSKVVEELGTRVKNKRIPVAAEC